MAVKNKAPQGRRWTVDTHPEREKIIAAMIKGEQSLRSIAEQFGISSACITRYMQGKLASQAGAVLAEESDRNGSALLKRVETVMKRMQKLYDACDEYLQHPDDPNRYELGPKAWEIDVAYRLPDPKNPKRTVSGHDTLNNLLAKCESKKNWPTSIRMMHSDPRKLIIDTASVLSKQLELIAKIQGKIQGPDGNTVVNVLVVNQKGKDE
jgi:predicted transcriptional regulator